MSSLVKRDGLQILLVGKTGRKKLSSDSILQTHTFKSANPAKSEASETQIAYSNFRGRKIHAVDIRGLINIENEETAVKVISEAMVMNPEGYHAIVLEVKYGSCCADEDVKLMRVLKEVLGNDFLRCHGILLLTFGDNSETDKRVNKRNLNFESWLGKQTEPNIHSLIKECEPRIILFDNKCRDEQAKQKQTDQLIEMAEDITKHGKKYTMETFLKAQKQEDRLSLCLGRPFLNEEHLRQIFITKKKFEDIDLNSVTIDEKLESLRTCQIEADIVYRALKRDDRELNALAVALKLVENLQRSINDKLEKLNSVQSYAKQDDNNILENLKKDPKKFQLTNYEEEFFRMKKEIIEKLEEERIQRFNKAVEQDRVIVVTTETTYNEIVATNEINGVLQEVNMFFSTSVNEKWTWSE